MDFRPPRALYIHVPLCASKCAYCDFFSLPRSCADLPSQEVLVQALLDRTQSALELYSPPGAPALETLYIGGGTPTALGRPEFRHLLLGLKSLVGPVKEWTIEANPESLDAAHLDAAEEAGVNRISLGVQSLDDGLLARLGRPADSATALSALAMAGARGRFRLSADLIAGLPRSLALEAEVARLLEAGIEHLSLYDLSLEEGTALEAQVRAGTFILPDQDLAFEEVQRAGAVLKAAGFRRYEVSNWSRPGAECLHNRAYWRLDSYLGLGPGGVSTLQGLDAAQARPGSRGSALRLEETRDLHAFLEDRSGSLATTSRISAKDSAFEAIMMGYRTMWGPDKAGFAARFGLSLEALIGRTMSAWSPRFTGLGGLDEAGLDLLNSFLVDCLEELELAFPGGAADHLADPSLS